MVRGQPVVWTEEHARALQLLTAPRGIGKELVYL
jgi:hypothetical protein